MNKVFKPFVLPLILTGLSAFCLFGSVGCSRQPTAADYQRIYNDKSLTPEQQVDAINALTPNPIISMYEQTLPVAGIGIVILIAAVSAKKKMDADKLASRGAASAGAKHAHPSATAHPSKPVSKAASADNRRPNDKQKPQPQSTAASAYRARTEELEKPVKKLPETQDEVSAIPLDQRGMSYFSSRPLPSRELLEVSLLIGGELKSVYASQEEADQIKTGVVPRVRAFTVNGESIPWYEWDMYDPYAHYVLLNERGWTGLANHVIACWLKVEHINPSLWGYYPTEEVEEVALEDYAAEPFDMEEPPVDGSVENASTDDAVLIAPMPQQFDDVLTPPHDGAKVTDAENGSGPGH